MHPKHNLHLDFQRQHAAKWFVLRVHQPSAVHLDNLSNWQLTSLWCVTLLILLFPPIIDLRQTPWIQAGKGVPMGGTP